MTALVLRIWVVEVVMFVLSFALLALEEFCELPQISLELLLVLLVDRHVIKHPRSINFSGVISNEHHLTRSTLSFGYFV